MVATVLDMEVHAVRAVQRPSGDLFTDKKEAFDRQWREDALVTLGERGGVRGADFLLADELMSSNTFRVDLQGHLSRTLLPPVGMPEGKKLSPLIYCLSSAR